MSAEFSASDASALVDKYVADRIESELRAIELQIRHVAASGHTRTRIFFESDGLRSRVLTILVERGFCVNVFTMSGHLRPYALEISW